MLLTLDSHTAGFKFGGAKILALKLQISRVTVPFKPNAEVVLTEYRMQNERRKGIS